MTWHIDAGIPHEGHLDLDLGEITVLVGENNSGKTAVLDALRVCLRDLGPRRRVVFEALDFHLADATADPASAKPIRIEITFSEQSTGEWSDELIGRLDRDNVLQVDDHDRSHVMLRVTCAYEDELLAEELKTWRELHEDLARERGSGRLTLNVYLQQMDLVSKAPRPRPDAVRCMTVHGSKGLGFRHVYLIGMSQEVFPSFQALRSGEQGKELEEERRNCFVAITRVERTLTLTRAEEYYGHPKRPSQFLREMGIL